MRINNNISSLNLQNKLQTNQSAMSKSLEKLSSGLRINRAGDDAAGLTISEKMRGQIRGLKQAEKNATGAISLVQTAEGALNEIHSILQRMNELATQASDGSLATTDRTAISNEISNLNGEIDRISKSTRFNGNTLIAGTFGVQLDKATSGIAVGTAGVTSIDISGAAASKTYTITSSGANAYIMTESGTTDTQHISLNDGTAGVLNFSKFGIKITVNGTQTAAGIAASDAMGAGSLPGTIVTGASVAVEIQIGSQDSADERMGISIAKIDSSATSLNTTSVAVDSAANARAGMTVIQSAIDTVSAERSKLGAYQNRLDHTIANLSTTAENMQAAESQIRDVDMAKEMSEFTKAQILGQAATAMLAQANQVPQGVLKLLG